MQPIFLTAEWRNLIMINYGVDPGILQPYLPAGTELDLWQGNCYISLVGFLFAHTRVLGLSVPFHRNFEEVNLRFYVRRKEGEEWKRGVVFIKEIVPKSAITLVANTLYGEHYVTMPMRHRWEEENKTLRVSYEWQFQGRWNSLGVTAGPHPIPMAEGSEEQFIAEHYWGYTALKNGHTSEYKVEHPSWRVYPIHSHSVDCDAKELYGTEFAAAMAKEPTSVFMAEGSGISVRQGGKVGSRQ